MRVVLCTAELLCIWRPSLCIQRDPWGSKKKAARDMCGPRLPFQRPKVWLCDSYSAQLPSRSQRQQLSCFLFLTGQHC